MFLLIIYITVNIKTVLL